MRATHVAQRSRHFIRTALVAVGGTLLSSCSDIAGLRGGDIPPPDKGQYNVGFTMFSATMTAGRSTRVQVYYPTEAPTTCATLYRIETAAAGPFFLSSPLCASSDADVAPGPHPTIIFDHGGGTAGADFQRVNQLPVHELLASHGFIVVVALHSADPVARIRDLGVLTTLMLDKSANAADSFAGRVDAQRIGASGISAGAASAFNFAAGRAEAGIARDPRIKALAVYEPARAAVALSDAATLSIPYLIMAGSQSDASLFAPDLFAATTAAPHRIYVKNPGALHQSYATELCALIEEAREAALQADPSLPEPLTTNTPTNAGASIAFSQWNIGATQLAAFGPGFGGGRNICNHVGVKSIRSLDQNGDGFTDSPPFYTGEGAFVDPSTLGPSPSAEIMVPTVALYTVAFWKVFLEEDRRYTPFLTRGYAQAHGLPAIVDFRP